MKFNAPTEPPPVPWESGLLDSRIEAQLTQSIENARHGHLPRDFRLAHPVKKFEQPQIIASPGETLSSTTLSGLMASCGVAAVDGYLAIKDYATSKGLDLAEFHHKGIDLQDLISTLVIHTQRMAEMESRASGAQRYKR